MATPRAQIRISKNGDSHLEGMERSNICDVLKEMATVAGKVISQEDKEHTPVYHSVTQKGA